MQNMMHTLWSILALVAGGAIGFGFGKVQEMALRRNEARQRDGRLNNGWSIMPGAGARVAFLLITFVLIQVVCPMLFVNDIKWWVSGGVVAGYGIVLYWQLRRRISGNK